MHMNTSTGGRFGHFENTRVQGSFYRAGFLQATLKTHFKAEELYVGGGQPTQRAAN